jgi:hypothetical protein
MFTEMKSTVSTLTRTTTGNTLPGAFLDRFVASRRRTHPIIQLGAGGFSFFGILPWRARVGASQCKEALIENKGRYILSSNSQFNLFKKEL